MAPGRKPIRVQKRREKRISTPFWNGENFSQFNKKERYLKRKKVSKREIGHGDFLARMRRLEIVSVGVAVLLER